MTDFHKYTFGQLPARKTVIDGKTYRQLEFGEVIDSADYFTAKGSNSPSPVKNALNMAGTKYNPHRRHKNITIWREV